MTDQTATAAPTEADTAITDRASGIRSVARFEPAVAGTVLFAAVGLVTGEPLLFFAAAVPTAFVAYSSLSSAPPDPETLEYTRTIDSTRVFPGAETTVTLTVTNPTDTAIPSVDIVDGIPDDVVVTDGTPRASTPIGPDSSVTVTYDVSATRGTYTFAAPTVQTANTANTVTNRALPSVTGDTSLTCTVALDAVSLPEQTAPYVGPVPTDTGGPGIEFFATREYHSSDPANRINWREYAKTGDLTTVQYREEKAARIVVTVDARRSARVSAHPGLPTGTALAGYAGAVLVRALADAGHSVGAAVLGTAEPGPRSTEPALIKPGSPNAAQRAITACETAASLTDPGQDSAPETGAPDRSTAPADTVITRLRNSLPPDAQVLLVTPALDATPTALVDALTPYDHPVTVLSPDVTTPARADPTVDAADPFDRAQTAGQRVRSADRAAQLTALDRRGITTIDWGPDTDLAVALNTALRAITT